MHIGERGFKYQLIVKKVWFYIMLCTLISVGNVIASEEVFITSAALRSYQQKETEIYNKFKDGLKTCAIALEESPEYRKYYIRDREKNYGKDRDHVNALIRQQWLRKGVPIKQNALDSLKKEIPYASIGGYNYFLSQLEMKDYQFGFYNLCGAFYNIDRLKDKVDKVFENYPERMSTYWKNPIEIAEKKEKARTEIAEKEAKARAATQQFPGQLQLANNGDPVAQNTVGAAYYNGEGVSKDIRTARAWFEKSAANGCWQATTWLGQIYFNSEGGTYEEGPIHMRRSAALKWYRRAADYGWEQAQGWIDRIQREAKEGGYLDKIQ